MEENLNQDNVASEKDSEQVFSNPDQPQEPVIGGIADFEEFDEAFIKDSNADEKLSMLKDLQLNVFIELGRTQMYIKDILELERGYVIELDKLASEPVEIFVNNKKIAEGEVVVIDKHFGIRITNLNEANKALKGLI